MTTNNVVNKDAVLAAMRAQEDEARGDRERAEGLVEAVEGDRLKHSTEHGHERHREVRYLGEKEKEQLLRALRAEVARATEVLGRVTAAREQVESGELVVVVKGRVNP